MTESKSGIDPALVCVSMRMGWLNKRRRQPTYAVYVDGRAVGSSPYSATSAIVLPEGPHSVQVRISPWSSDIVELELRGGDKVDLVCGMKPLLRGGFWKTVEMKFHWFFVPLICAAYYFPALAQFVEQHFKLEFLAVLGLLLIGTVFAFFRMFSREPGATLSLVHAENSRDEEPLEGTAREKTFAALNRLIASGVQPFFVLPPTPGLVREGFSNDAALDTTPANNPVPLPLLAVLAAVDICVVLLITMPWVKAPWMLLLVAPLNGVLGGLLLGLQTLLIVWLRTRLSGKLNSRIHKGPSPGRPFPSRN